MTIAIKKALPTMRTALLLLCTAGVGTAVYAQEAPPPPPDTQQGPPPDAPPPGGGYGHGGRGMGGERQLGMMTKQLNLTPDQVTSIKKIDSDSRDKMMALRQDTTSDPADRRKQMGSIMKAREDSIKAVLNDDQKVKYAAMLEREREHRQERGGNDQGGPPPPPPQN